MYTRVKTDPSHPVQSRSRTQQASIPDVVERIASRQLLVLASQENSFRARRLCDANHDFDLIGSM